QLGVPLDVLLERRPLAAALPVEELLGQEFHRVPLAAGGLHRSAPVAQQARPAPPRRHSGAPAEDTIGIGRRIGPSRAPLSTYPGPAGRCPRARGIFSGGASAPSDGRATSVPVFRRWPGSVRPRCSGDSAVAVREILPEAVLRASVRRHEWR